MNHKGRRRATAGVPKKKNKFIQEQSSLLSYMAEPTPKPIKPPIKAGNEPVEKLKSERSPRRLKHPKRWKNNDENKNYRSLWRDRNFE